MRRLAAIGNSTLQAAAAGYTRLDERLHDGHGSGAYAQLLRGSQNIIENSLRMIFSF